MPRRFLGQAIFLRHGQTDYTDVFPDLTEEGIKTIEKSAQAIMPFIEGHQNIVIIASPVARSLGSAAVVARTIGYQGKIKKEPNIQAAVVKDRMLAKAIFFEHVANGGMRGLSVAYGNDPRYEDAKIIEPRSEVKKRFLGYFAHLIRSLLINTGLAPCFIHVSHYETLYHFVENLFGLDYKKEDPLDNGEIIVVSIYDVSIECIVEMEVTFRGKTIREKFFDYKNKEIR